MELPTNSLPFCGLKIGDHSSNGKGPENKKVYFSLLNQISTKQQDDANDDNWILYLENVKSWAQGFTGQFA